MLLLAGLVALLIATAAALSYGFVAAYFVGIVGAFLAIIGMGVRMALKPRAPTSAEDPVKMVASASDPRTQ